MGYSKKKTGAYFGSRSTHPSMPMFFCIHSDVIYAGQTLESCVSDEALDKILEQNRDQTLVDLGAIVDTALLLGRCSDQIACAPQKS